ncbi:HEAT repeat domain-containing protein [Nocardia brasiliensis]|nr:HEAT repeat domain-containing protein [Nocardia brasiliensis]
MRDVGSGRRRALLHLHGYRREWVKPRFIEVSARDLDPEVRATTAHVIATRGARTHRTVLDQLRDDPAPHVRKTAAQAFGRLSPRHGPALQQHTFGLRRSSARATVPRSPSGSKTLDAVHN